MKLDIGTNLKVINSTKQDFVKKYENIEFWLKNPTSVTEPTIILKNLPYNSVTSCNYLYIQDWGSYYWIDSIEYTTNDIRTLKCHRDPLATFKELILNTECYVRYTSSINEATVQDFLLDDERLNPEVQYDTSTQNVFTSMAGISFDSTGCVVVRSMVMASDGAGTLTYVLKTADFLTAIRSFANTFISNITDAVKYLLGNSNFKENIISAVWLPLKYDDMPGSNSSTFCIGGFSTSISCKLYSNIVEWKYATGTINLTLGLPSSNKRFLRGKKYNNVQFIHPGGTINLSNDDLIDMSTIECRLTFDCTAGDYFISFKPYEAGGIAGGTTYPMVKGNIALDILYLGTTSSDPVLSMMSSISTFGLKAAAAASGNLLASKAVDKIADIGEMGGFSQVSMSPDGYNSSQSSSFISMLACMKGTGLDFTTCFRVEIDTWLPRIFIQGASQMDFYPSFAAKYGYPFHGMTVLRLVEEGAYVQCVNANLGISQFTSIVLRAPLPDEIRAINTFLNNGVYLE